MSQSSYIMTPRTIKLRLTEKVATVYFPRNVTEDKARKQWLRARGFSATVEDMAGRIQDGAWIPAAHCRIVTRPVVQESFCGASLARTSKTLKPEDLAACYALLLESFSKFRLPGQLTPEMKLKTTRRGFAHISRIAPWFSIPSWVLNTCEDFVIYYMAHELAHHARGGVHHGPAMCQVEAELLAPFGIQIEYKGGRGANQPWYPKRLTRPDGSTICYARGASKSPVD